MALADEPVTHLEQGGSLGDAKAVPRQSSERRQKTAVAQGEEAGAQSSDSGIIVRSILLFDT
jgi:hypothetical protein